MEYLMFGPFGPRTFGVLAAALGLYAFLPYIADVVRGKTRPQRASWIIWAALSSISCIAQIYEGADGSLAYVVVQASATVFIATLAVFMGQGRLFTARDMAFLGAATVGLVLWALTHSPVYALSISIAVSALGSLLTISKAYQAPGTETFSTWALSGLGAVFAILSVGTFDAVLLAYPVYLLILYTAIIGAMIAGRLKTRQPVFESSRATL